MTVDGERLATLEQIVRDLRDDVRGMTEQTERSRRRLHDLEGFAQTYLDLQKVQRRQEADQYRRMGAAIACGGLAMALAMVVLTVVTLLLHN